MNKRIWLAALLAILAPACSGDDVAGPGTDTPGTSNKPAWVWQNPIPHGNDFVGIEAFGNDRVIAVSTHEVIQTRDGGATWKVLDIGINQKDSFTVMDLYRRGSVVVILTNRGIALSTDNGNSWHRRSDPPFSANAIAFRDAVNGVAVGNNGKIATTGDGGETWTPRTSGVETRLDCVEFFDEQIVYIGGRTTGAGLLLRSDDGGETWNAVTNITAHIEIHEINITGGIIRVTDSGGNVIFSTNNGTTWADERPATFSLLDLDVFDHVNVMAAGEDGAIYLSDNAGLDWEAVLTDLDITLFAVSYLSDNELWAAGEDGRIYRSSDAGATWQPAHGGFRFDLYDVSFGSPDAGIAVGPTYMDAFRIRCGVLITSDGGATWLHRTLGGSSILCQAGDLNAVGMFDGNNAVVVGDAGSLWDTADGGLSWTQRDAKTTLDLYDVDFGDDARGIAVGEFGQVRVSSDGGATWNAPVGGAGTNEDLFTVSFGTPDIAMLGGGGGVIRRTVDGGASWMPANGNLTLTSVREIVALDDTSAVMIASDGASVSVYRTGDGGDNWETGQSVVGGAAMSFASKSRGYMVGSFGHVRVTDDGGATWELLQTPTDEFLSGVVTFGSKTAIVVGAGGVIMRTPSGGK